MDDVGRVIAELADHLDLRDDPTLADRVVAAIDVDRVDAPAVRGRRRRTFAAALALAFAGLGVTAGPAIADWLRVRIGGVEVERAERPEAPGDLGVGLDLGRRVHLGDGDGGFTFAPRTLSREHGRPTFWSNDVDGVAVFSSVYAASRELPATRAGVGALVQQFDASLEDPALMRKVIGANVVIEPIAVNGRAGVWIEGEHAIAMRHRDGDVRFAPGRLAANAVVWQDGDTTYRLESALDRDAAIALAETLRY
ncbi:MAG TPA: hypothetical protein VF230_04670 [Acidimicrobiales bacterium]